MAAIHIYAGMGLAATRKDFNFTLNFDAAKRAIGARLKKELQDHFWKLHADRHKGLSKTGFYEEAARSVDVEYPGDDIEVTTDRRGILLRYFGSGGLPGGVVRPVRAKYLTIPAIAEAYGKPARSFSGLVFVKFKSGAAALMEAAPKGARVAKTGKKVKNSFKLAGTQGAFSRRVFYWLVKETRHLPDESVLPTQTALEDAVIEEAEKYIETHFGERLLLQN